MKKLTKIVSLAVSILMLVGIFSSVPFSAFAAETGKSLTGIAVFTDENTKTVFKFENGKTETVKNAVKAESLEQNAIVEDVESYEIKYKNKSVAKVEPRDVYAAGSSAPLNGYFALTFIIPDTQKEVFLTGLSAENVDVVEKKLLASYGKGKDFTMESLDFIDAEKKMVDDEMLCWAGTNSNMLKYTGWAQKAGFDTEDDILEDYCQNFVDDGYFVSSGLEWFFDGKSDSAVKTENSGGYLKEYLSENIIKDYKVSDFAECGPQMIRDLKAGKGIGLSINWLGPDDEFMDMAHAITLFGVVTDKSCDEDDLNYYDSFIIADSDNSTGYNRDKSDSENDRRFAPNTLTLIELEPFVNEDDNISSVVGKDYRGVLYLYTTLEPYSDAMEQYRETNPHATLNRNTSYDFSVDDVFVSNVGGGAKSENVYNDDVYASFKASDKSTIPSNGGKDFKGKLDAELTLYNEDGEELKTRTTELDVDLEHYGILGDFNLNELGIGKYKAKVTIAESSEFKEAYYLNNSKTIEFEVVNKDYDLSGVKISTDTDTIEFEPGEVSKKINLNYEGLETSELCQNYDEVNVYYSNYADNKWSLWSAVYSPEEGGEPVGNRTAKAYGKAETKASDLPENVVVEAEGTKLRFRLEFVKDSVAYSVVSSEYPISSTDFRVNWSASNTEKTSVIQQGANKLNDGEQFAFTIKNISVGEHEAIKGTYNLIADFGMEIEDEDDDDDYYDDNDDYDEDDEGDDIVRITDPVPFSIETGEETAEIVINSWNEDVNLDRTCSILVEIETEQFGINTEHISTLRIQEDKSTVITTGKDKVDSADGKISLREAVAYAGETGKEITVGKNVKGSINLNSEIEIKKDIKLDGSVEGGPQTSCLADISTQEISDGTSAGYQLFRIGKNVDVEIKNTRLSCGTADKGGAVYVDGGNLKLDNCHLGFCTAKLKGGAVYMNGGSLIAKNTDFKSNTAPFGTDIYLDGGAKAELLNCNLVPDVETRGIVYNYDGSLDIINSTIIPGDVDDYDEYTNGKEYNRAIISNKNTNVVNSIVFTRNDTAVSGDVDVYSSVTNGLEPEVNADENTIEREMEQICRLSEDGTPLFSFPDVDHAVLYLLDEAKLGSKTSLNDGKITLTDSKGNVTRTNLTTSFTEDELSRDMMGNQRTTIFGSFSDIIIYGELLTPENTTFTGIDSLIYTGNPLTQKFEVFCNGELLDYGVDYSVEYKNNINAGTATITVTGMNDFRGSVDETFTIEKAKNTMTAKAVTKTVKYSKLKKAKQTVKNSIVVKKNKGAVSYKKLSGSKKLTINSKGVVTVKKGTKKGTCKIKVKVTAKGTLNYKKLSKTVTVTIKVK